MEREIDKTELLIKLAHRIKPIVDNESGGFDFIEPVDIERIAFNWKGPKHICNADDLSPIVVIRTFHKAASPMFFKASIAEVLSQIPEEVLTMKPVAFSTRLVSTDLATCYNSSAQTHKAETTLYIGELPGFVKSQPVIYEGREIHPA